MSILILFKYHYAAFFMTANRLIILIFYLFTYFLLLKIISISSIFSFNNRISIWFYLISIFGHNSPWYSTKAPQTCLRTLKLPFCTIYFIFFCILQSLLCRIDFNDKEILKKIAHYNAMINSNVSEKKIKKSIDLTFWRWHCNIYVNI